MPATEALPRTVGAVGLRMSRTAVEGALGPLTCHDSPDGFEVCRATDPNRGESTLELFFVHGEVVSLAYEIPAPADVLSHLESLTKRHGKPSLSGLTERDRDGRLHETYGWKDDKSLYSIRFVWHEEPSKPRRLGGTVVTLWDREAYGAWERSRVRTPPASTPKVT